MVVTMIVVVNLNQKSNRKQRLSNQIKKKRKREPSQKTDRKDSAVVMMMKINKDNKN